MGDTTEFRHQKRPRVAANDVSRVGKKILSRLLGVGILRTVVGDSRDQYQLF